MPFVILWRSCLAEIMPWPPNWSLIWRSLALAMSIKIHPYTYASSHPLSEPLILTKVWKWKNTLDRPLVHRRVNQSIRISFLHISYITWCPENKYNITTSGVTLVFTLKYCCSILLIESDIYTYSSYWFLENSRQSQWKGWSTAPHGYVLNSNVGILN